MTYTFPLYDGVSVARFSCKIGEKKIIGIVKERNTARQEYDEAVSKGQTAALFEQNIDAADVFTTSIGNVPAGEEVFIDITYLGELKNDAETDGARFTIPTQIAPRYGNAHGATTSSSKNEGGIEITVDICLEEGNAIRGIQSPSHPISVTMGRVSTDNDEDIFETHMGSSTLTLGNTELDKDFIIVVQAKGQDTPRALLETHTTFPNQRAIMTTLIPKFNLPNESPEIVFVVDRSGSMGGKMHLVIEALKVFLKSLPTSVKFNICSFGSRHSFLFERSQTYDAVSLKNAMDHIQPHIFDANYGGTEMLEPVKDVLKRRYKDKALEVLLLTDGEIWRQDEMFATVTVASKQRARFFTLGIGSSASSSLVEGIARAGRGFSQWVNDGERIDKRIVRMLKAALTPHIEYKLEIKYSQSSSSDEDDFEIIESFEKSINLLNVKESKEKTSVSKKVISLFNPKAKDEPTNPSAGRYDHLPSIPIPNVLQTPYSIPPLYPHSRSTIYLLLSPDAPSSMPVSVTLRGKSEHGDLELELPIQDIGSGATVHQLAARKAMQELEEGRGWIVEAKDKSGKPLKSTNEGNWDLLVEREAVRLGTTFQIGGKHCSFVAVIEGDNATTVSTSSNNLQDYQQNLMVLEQQNKKRLMMARASPGSRGGSALASTHSVSIATPQASFASFGSAADGSLFSATKSKSVFGSSNFGSARRKASNSSSIQPPSGAFGFAPEGVAPQYQVNASQNSSGSAGGSGGLFGDARDRSMRHVQAKSMQPPPPPPPPSTMHYNTTTSLAHMPQVSHIATYVPQNETFNLDFSTIENSDALDNFDFDKFMRTGPNDSLMDTDSSQSVTAFGSSFVPGHEMQGNHSSDGDMKPLEKMQKLIDLQTFTGSWSRTAELLAMLSHGKVSLTQQSEITTAIKDAGDGMLSDGVIDGLSVEALVTSLAIAWFETVVPNEADVWEMVVDKARGWLEGKMDGSDQVDILVNICKNIYRV